MGPLEIGSPGVIAPPFDSVISQAVKNEGKGYDAIASSFRLDRFKQVNII